MNNENFRKDSDFDKSDFQDFNQLQCFSVAELKRKADKVKAKKHWNAVDKNEERFEAICKELTYHWFNRNKGRIESLIVRTMASGGQDIKFGIAVGNLKSRSKVSRLKIAYEIAHKEGIMDVTRDNQVVLSLDKRYRYMLLYGIIDHNDFTGYGGWNKKCLDRIPFFRMVVKFNLEQMCKGFEIDFDEHSSIVFRW